MHFRDCGDGFSKVDPLAPAREMTLPFDDGYSLLLGHRVISAMLGASHSERRIGGFSFRSHGGHAYCAQVSVTMQTVSYLAICSAIENMALPRVVASADYAGGGC